MEKIENEITENNFNRLAISIMSKYNCNYAVAMERLTGMKLNLVCGEEIKNSIPLQAAFLTAVNTGKRAFLGGVNVILPDDIHCLLPWSGIKTLNEIASDLGAIILNKADEGYFTLTFGLPGDIDNGALQIISNDWQGGFLCDGEDVKLDPGTNIPLAGIAAGALGIGTAFLRESGIHISSGNSSCGISLWRPDLPWLDKDAVGPKVNFLPQKYWFLGLGHLGQAYLWTLGFLPYKFPNEVEVHLQDYDRIVAANISAGLLCESSLTGKYKTRVCSTWLEDRGFNTIITERKFDAFTRCHEGDPLIALCGFDSAPSRAQLENAGFDLIVEVALGGNLSLFDNIIMHTFPQAYKTPGEIWNDSQENIEVNLIVLKHFANLEENECGILAQTLSSKAISSSFVGAFAGALAISEVVRGLNGGDRFDTIVAQLRSINYRRAVHNSNKQYTAELSRNGFCKI